MHTLLKLYFLFLLFFVYAVQAQTLSGNIINQNGDGVEGVQLQLYIFPNVYSTISTWDGSFYFNNITGVKKELLPNGYAVSANYPNPFNPKTRFEFTMPQSGNLKVELFNILGQKVISDIIKAASAGRSFVDLELNGLANGVYIARITLDEKYSIIRKLMLLYGSQHLAGNSNNSGFTFGKLENISFNAAETKIDSLVITGKTIYKKTFLNLPPLQGNSLSLRGLRVITPCPSIPTINYEGTTYNTVLIGNQCWLRESLNTGVMVPLSTYTSGGPVIYKHCYQDDSLNCEKYGALYDWRTAMQSTSTLVYKYPRGICPEGWHIPNKEFHILTSYANNNGNWFKREDQGEGKGKGTNESGFSALFYRYPGSSAALTSYWSSWDEIANYADSFELDDTSSNIYLRIRTQNKLSSIRCVKDDDSTATLPENPVLNKPENQTAELAEPLIVTWFPSPRAKSYALQLSEDSAFTRIIFSQNNITETFTELTTLNYPKKYFWRVSASNNFGTSSYSDIRYFTISNSIDTRCPGTSAVVDTRDGRVKIYNTVKIGEQCWLKENIDLGTMIPGNKSQTNNSTFEKYCYNNDTAYCIKYGGLYQWDEAMQYISSEKAHGICPDGWHIPTAAEFNTLNNEVKKNGNSLKAYGQGAFNGSGTNESGFSALLAGVKYFSDSESNYLNYYTSFWGSSLDNVNYSFSMYLDRNSSFISLGYRKPADGFSVRCIKN